MSSLLNSVAVGRQSGENAGSILQAYIQTGPKLTQDHTVNNAPANTAPNPAGAIDPLAR